MSLKEEMEKMKYDRRLLNWNIKNNILNEEELKKHLSQLEDRSELSDSLFLYSQEKTKEEKKKSAEDNSNLIQENTGNKQS